MRYNAYKEGVKLKRYKPYVVLSFILIFVGTLFFIGRTDQLIQIEHPHQFNDQWIFEQTTIDLPRDVDVNVNEWYTISKVLDQSFDNDQVILVRTSLSNIRVKLDDEIIYEKIYGQKASEPFASTWHFITIPLHSEGKVLSISYASPYQQMAGQMNGIFIGNHSMHYAFLVRNYGIRVILSTLVFVIGFAMMIADFFISKNQQKGYVYAGMFAVLLSLWMFAESRIVQFFTGSELFIGSLAYLVLPLILLPIIGYLKTNILAKYTKLIHAIIPVFIIHFVLVITLHFTGVLDFFESVTLTQILLGITILTLLSLIIVEIRVYKNENALKFIKAFSFLIIFAFFEFLGFAFGDFDNTSVYISYGLGILMIGLLYNYIVYIIQRLKMSYEKEFYEKLAFMDYLTKGQNRLAFERDLDYTFSQTVLKENLRLIMFDLDGLKKVNDSYGHLKGDEAIIKAYEVISKTFESYGTCYRIGGDEFACLCQNLNEQTYLELKEALLKKTKDIEDETDYHFGLSLGTAVCSENVCMSTDLIYEADMDMYQAKEHEGLSTR